MSMCRTSQTVTNITVHKHFNDWESKFYAKREALIREKKRFFVKSLHKMVTPPPPSPFYEVPIYLFFVKFLSEKKNDFEGCLKGVYECFKGV